jgi:O-antigen ligase
MGSKEVMDPKIIAYRFYSRRHSNVPVYPLAILLISFFYCLPLGRYSIGGFNTDLRVYDIIILLVVFYYFANSTFTGELRMLFGSTEWFHRWLKFLGVMTILSILIAVMYSGTSFLLPSLIRVYRFIAYLFVPFLVFCAVRTKSDYLFLFKLFFGLCAFVGIIGFAQGMGVLETFWPEYWVQMYSEMRAPVATLSPHHKHIGVIMLVAVCLGIGYLQFTPNVILKVMIAIICLIMFTVPLFAGTRTYLLGFAGVIPAILLVGRGKSVLPIALIIVGAAIFLNYSNTDIVEKVEAKFDERVTSRIEKLGYEGVYRERTFIYLDILRTLKERPYLFFTGTGYQNIHNFIGATGAHNNFLQVLMELGILGFIVFMLFISSTWKNLKSVERQIQDFEIKTVAQYTWVALCGVILTMFVGETFWGQTAMFTLAGQLSFLFALAISPLYWLKRYAWQAKIKLIKQKQDAGID